jgi:predicted 3-demethylubiquinone-9 3-methyltransferase (glyoxalase superfamily)
MQKVTPCLWFDGRAEEAARFYTSVFKDSAIGSISPMSARFRLNGLEFIALNGGPQYKFNEAISFFVRCETQDEIDYYWEKLSAGGVGGRSLRRAVDGAGSRCLNVRQRRVQT